MDKAPFSTLHDVPLVLRRLAERARLANAPVHEPRAAEAMLGGMLEASAPPSGWPTTWQSVPGFQRRSGPSKAAAGLCARAWDRKIHDLRVELIEGLGDPFEGRRAAPAAAETHEALARAGFFEARDEGKLLAVARRLAPFHREGTTTSREDGSASAGSAST